MADGTAGGRETMNECMHATVRELFVSDSVKVYRCANCEETLVAILRAQMGESKLWQQAMPVKQLKMVVESLNAENEKLHKQLQAESLAFYLLRDERDNLAAELAAAREALECTFNWAMTEESDPNGGFDIFAEDIVPMIGRILGRE